MSYILEALRKAERERRFSEAPSVPEILSIQPTQRRKWLPWLAALLLLAINCVLLWHFWVNGKNNVNQPVPLPASGKSVKPVQKLPPKAENQTTLINPITNPVPPTINPTGQTGNVEITHPSGIVKPTAKAPAMPTPYQAKQPISPLDLQQSVASKPERTIESPSIGETNAKHLEERLTQEGQAHIIKENLKPLITKDHLASVKMMTRQRDDDQEQDMDPSVPRLNEMPQEKKDNAHFKINVLAYSNNPEERFAVINMVKYTKGERLPGGEILQDIQANGVVLELNGRHFRVSNH